MASQRGQPVILHRKMHQKYTKSPKKKDQGEDKPDNNGVRDNNGEKGFGRLNKMLFNDFT